MSRWFWLILLVLLWLHRGGWWGGGVYLEEDVVTHFYASKGRLYQLFHGLENWSQWDPLLGLGAPRLANVQVGWFSPLSLWFAWLPPLRAWQFYPLLGSLLLSLSAAWAAREGGLRHPGLAAWVALVWAQSQCILFEAQHPPYLESMVAALFSLAAALRYWRGGRSRILLLVVAGGYLHIASGSPSAIFFDHACLALLLPWFWHGIRPSARRAAVTVLAYLAGCLLAFPALAPMLEYHSHSHRSSVQVAGPEFADSYRFTALEVLRRMAAESLLGPPVPSPTAMGYPVQRDLSVAVTLLALSALALPRLRWLALLSLFLMFQALGEAGGGVWLLHKLVPGTLSIRGPGRYFLLGSWGLVLSAGLAWQHWRSLGGKPARLADGLAAYGFVFALLAHQVVYYPPELTQGPPAPDGPGAVATFAYSQPPPPLLWSTLFLLEGRRNLLAPQEPYERGFLLGLACSQFGGEGSERLGKLVHAGRQVPVRNPQAPLLRSWGLTWLLEGAGDGFRWRRLQPDPPRYWWAVPSSEAPALWASSSSTSPFETAVVEGPLPAGTTAPGLIVEEARSADHQRLRVQGSGLLLVADQWDPGWRCRIDGREVPVLRANFALKACWVPAGAQSVEWTYQNRWWPRALWVHGLGWLCTLALWWWARPSRSQAGTA